MPRTKSIHSGFENWGALETTLLWVRELSSSEGEESGPFLSFPSLALFIKKGGLTFNFEEKEHYSAGVWIFPKTGQATYVLAPESSVLVIRFFIKWPNGNPLFDRSQTVCFEEAKVPKLAKAADRLARFVKRHGMLEIRRHSPRLTGTLENYMMLQPLFSAWAAACYTSFVKFGYEPTRFLPISGRMQKSLRYLRDRSLASPFNERELAEFTGVSLSQICKTFVQEIGVTPQSYWNDRRLRAARLDLTDRDKSIKEIAYSLGFSSQGHFSNWFQKQMGCTPRAFRNGEAGS